MIESMTVQQTENLNQETIPMTDSDFRVVVISGPSGSGKTTIVNRLLEQSPVRLIKSISATTRPAREKEIDGQDYHFLTREEFETKLDNGEFLEHAEVHRSGNLYGTLISEVERAKSENGWSLLEVDVEGTLNVLKHYPEAITIFLMTASTDGYEARLRARGTESEDVIQRRLETARAELKFAEQYKHQVVNDNLDRAVNEILSIFEQNRT